MDQNEINFIDAEERYHQQKLDYTQIIMRQIDKVRLAGSSEWRDGYWELKPFTIGNTTINQKVYIPDTREVYINSVDSLYDILLPYFDPVFEKADKELRTQHEKRYEAIVAKEEKAREEGHEKDAIKKHFDGVYAENRLKHRRYVFRELIKLLKRSELIDSKGVREVA